MPPSNSPSLHDAATQRGSSITVEMVDQIMSQMRLDSADPRSKVDEVTKLLRVLVVDMQDDVAQYVAKCLVETVGKMKINDSPTSSEKFKENSKPRASIANADGGDYSDPEDLSCFSPTKGSRLRAKPGNSGSRSSIQTGKSKVSPKRSASPFRRLVQGHGFKGVGTEAGLPPTSPNRWNQHASSATSSSIDNSAATFPSFSLHSATPSPAAAVPPPPAEHYATCAGQSPITFGTSPAPEPMSTSTTAPDSTNQAFNTSIPQFPSPPQDTELFSSPAVETPEIQGVEVPDECKTGLYKNRRKGQSPKFPFQAAVTSPCFTIGVSSHKNKGKTRRMQRKQTHPKAPDPPAPHTHHNPAPPCPPGVAADNFVPPIVSPPAATFQPPPQPVNAQTQSSFGGTSFPTSAPVDQRASSSSSGVPGFHGQQAVPVQTSVAFGEAAIPTGSATFQPAAAAAAAASSSSYSIAGHSVNPEQCASNMSDVQFCVGTCPKSAKKPSPGKNRRAKLTSPRRHDRTRVNAAAPASLYTQFSPPSTTALNSQAETTATSPQGNTDYMGYRERVEFLRGEGKNHYENGDYSGSVRMYTEALETHEGLTPQNPDDLKATLLGNRAAGLLMLGAYEAAAHDCFEAAKFVSESKSISSNSGLVLKLKLYARIGRALIKMGSLENATTTLSDACIFQDELEKLPCPDQEIQEYLNRLRSDILEGRTLLNRCRDNIEVIRGYGLHSPGDAAKISKRSNQNALAVIKAAISDMPGCRVLFEMLLSVLAALGRWRELLFSCERYAAETVVLDGISHKNVSRFPVAQYLKADAFNGCTPDKAATVKLSSKAIAEVAVRLPETFHALFLRGLRLEERCPSGISAADALSQATIHSYASDPEKAAWLSREKDKLQRTKASKEKGDRMFRTFDYDGAVKQYTECLSIDSEDTQGGESAGRLTAVLYCNRAAAYTCLLKFQEALSDCNAALGIHSYYMKAIFRRGRCYLKLNRFDEAQAEFERYIELVRSARGPDASLVFLNAPCLFDGPGEASDDDLKKAEDALEETKQAKEKAERAARFEEAERERRRAWSSEEFRKAERDAEARREKWYKGTGARPWDSFNGRSPNKGSRTNYYRRTNSARSNFERQDSSSYRGDYYRQHEQQEESHARSGYSYRRERQDEPQARNPASDNSDCHYKVLGVNRDASETDIKKAYRRKAAQYHPDKNNAPDAVQMFHRISLALEVLSDPTKRRQYDNPHVFRWQR
jgi:tetratricopeptide (TPR) repeat protein